MMEFRASAEAATLVIRQAVLLMPTRLVEEVTSMRV